MISSWLKSLSKCAWVLSHRESSNFGCYVSDLTHPALIKQNSTAGIGPHPVTGMAARFMPRISHQASWRQLFVPQVPPPHPPFGKIICILGTHTCSWWPHHVANFTNSFYWNLELSLIYKSEKRNNRWMKGCSIFLALLCLTQSNENTVVSFKAVEKNVQ